ncbi:MAG: bacteriohemerythrin [Aquabacterium sp.]
MAYFEWADDMVIDNGVIDADHRQLVTLVNQLHTATSEGQGQEIVDQVLQEVLKYTIEHLRREESLMASVNFPNLAGHKVGHQKFIERLDILRAKYESGSMTVASQLSTVLRDWLSLHIRRDDKELRKFLKHQAPGPSVH